MSDVSKFATTNISTIHTIKAGMFARLSKALSAYNQTMKFPYDKAMVLATGLPLELIDRLQSREQATQCGFIQRQAKTTKFNFSTVQLTFEAKRVTAAMAPLSVYRLPGNALDYVLAPRAIQLVDSYHAAVKFINEYPTYKKINKYSPELFNLVSAILVKDHPDAELVVDGRTVIPPSEIAQFKKIRSFGYAYQDLMMAPEEPPQAAQLVDFRRYIGVL